MKLYCYPVYSYLLSLIIFVVSAQANVSFSISALSHVDVGENFVTTIEVSNIDDLSGFEIVLEFEPVETICALENSDGDFQFDFKIVNIADCQDGTIQFAQASFTPKSGSGCLFSTSWKALTDGIATIRFISGALSNSNGSPIDYLTPPPVQIIVGNPVITPNVSIVAPEYVKPNEQFTTGVMISDVVDCMGIQFYYEISPANIVCADKNISGGFITGFEVENVVDCEKGIFKYSAATFSPKDGNGTLFTTDWMPQSEGVVTIRLIEGVLSNSNAEPIAFTHPESAQITIGNPNNKYDLNADGIISIKDLILLLQVFAGIKT